MYFHFTSCECLTVPLRQSDKHNISRSAYIHACSILIISPFPSPSVHVLTPSVSVIFKMSNTWKHSFSLDVFVYIPHSFVGRSLLLFSGLPCFYMGLVTIFTPYETNWQKMSPIQYRSPRQILSILNYPSILRETRFNYSCDIQSRCTHTGMWLAIVFHRWTPVVPYCRSNSRSPCMVIADGTTAWCVVSFTNLKCYIYRWKLNIECYTGV